MSNTGYKSKSKSGSQKLKIKNPNHLHDDLFASSDGEKSQDEIDKIQELLSEKNILEKKITIFERKLEIFKNEMPKKTEKEKTKLREFLEIKEEELKKLKIKKQNLENQIKEENLKERKKNSPSLKITPEPTEEELIERNKQITESILNFTQKLKEEDKNKKNTYKKNIIHSFDIKGGKNKKTKKNRKTIKNKKK